MIFRKAPYHIAIIMDGNGRWAQERKLPRIMGHRAGVRSVREVVKACAELQIPYLTLYAFSQENWKRPRSEINQLMGLLNHFLEAELRTLVRQGIRFMAIGRLEALPARVRQKINRLSEKTRDGKRMTLVLALNYGSRGEIVDAAKRLFKDRMRHNGADHEIEKLNEGTFSEYLYTAGLPDPDLLIRTSGEMRLSNFLLWQCSYSEIVISKKYWPDFGRQDLIEAVREFSERERRFGAVR